MQWHFLSLKAKLEMFLNHYGIDYYGVQGPIRGSKICSVYIKKSSLDRLMNLKGTSYFSYTFWFSKDHEFEDSIKFNVNCIRG